MRKFKQALALGLVGIVSLGGVGCGKSTEVKETLSTPVASETPVTTEEPVDTSDPNNNPNHPTSKYEAKDLGGRTFTFAYNWVPMPSSGDPEPDPATATLEDIAKYENLKRVEEKYNCKISYVNIPYEEMVEKLTTSVMAGSPFADAVMLDAQQILAPAINNQILALDEINLPNGDIFNAKAVLLPSGDVLGKQYAMEERNEQVSAVFLGVNLDIINNLGLENPVDLYEKGEWTWDKFLAIAKASTKDTDGDSVVDQWGISGVPLLLAKQLIASNDGYLTDDINLKEGLSDPKSMEALEFFSKLYNVDKVVYLANNDPWEWNGNLDYFKEGKSALFYLQNWMIPSGDSALHYNYTVVPMPKGPSNTTGATYITGTGGVAIPRGVEAPEDVMMIFEEINMWYGDDYSIKAEASREWLQTLYLTEEDVERAIAFAENKKIDITDGISEYPLNTVIGNLLIDGQTVAQTVEANKQLAQDRINAVLKK